MCNLGGRYQALRQESLGEQVPPIISRDGKLTLAVKQWAREAVVWLFQDRQEKLEGGRLSVDEIPYPEDFGRVLQSLGELYEFIVHNKLPAQDKGGERLDLQVKGIVFLIFLSSRKEEIQQKLNLSRQRLGWSTLTSVIPQNSFDSINKKLWSRLFERRFLGSNDYAYPLSVSGGRMLYMAIVYGQIWDENNCVANCFE